jgi:DNA-binding NarL/FixJ family response regulator
MLSETEINKSRQLGSAVMPAARSFARGSAEMPSEWGDWPFSGSAFARSGPITVGLIGGHCLLRNAIARHLAARDGMDVLYAFESVADFLASEVEKQPGVLLLDCDGGAPGGYQGAVRTLSAHTKSAIVIFCGEVCEEIIRCAIEYRVGGVILKSFSTDDVVAAMQYMSTGRTVMPAGWQRVVAMPSEQKISLSPRHRQILALIAQGMRNEEIAGELELSPNTIKFHIQALYLRLEVRNRVQAANQYAQITGDGS